MEPTAPLPSDAAAANAHDDALAAGAALATRLAALASLPDRAAQRQALLQLPSELRALGLALARLEAAGAEALPPGGADPLTGLADRPQLEAASAALALQFPDSPLMVIAVDVDHLGHVNDTWSRATGDAVLRAQSRPQDVLARAGGGLFVVALGGPVSTTRALLVAERLRGAIEGHAWAGLGEALRVTASIGVAARAPDESLEDALARAGAALQECKRGGRNQVRSLA